MFHFTFEIEVGDPNHVSYDRGIRLIHYKTRKNVYNLDFMSGGGWLRVDIRGWRRPLATVYCIQIFGVMLRYTRDDLDELERTCPD